MKNKHTKKEATKPHFSRKKGHKHGYSAQNSNNNNKETKEGILKTNQKSTGYIDMIDGSPSVYFPEGNLNHAFDGDIVTYNLTGKKDSRNKLKIAKVEKIITRSRDRIVGTVSIENNTWFVIPDNKKIYKKILLSEHGDVENGKKVFIEFLWETNSEYPTGNVLEVLGDSGNNDTEMESIVLEKGFATSFSPEVEKEAERLRDAEKTISNEEIAQRKDFRSTLTFTVDPADAKDFDDALSIKEIGEGTYEIGIHIADVSHFVTPHTKLDDEAIKRQFSVYLVDRTIPMLPEALSNDLCSLNPNEEKRAFSAVFEMNLKGQVTKEWFGRTIIKSDKRFSYEEAQETIEDSGKQYHKEFVVLNTIAYKLREQKVANGAIDFETPEVKFVLDEKGKPLSVIKKERKDAHKLIEEFMLLANKKVAHFIAEKTKGDMSEKSFIYRIHDAPDKDRISDLSVFLKALGYELESKDGVVTNKSIQKLIGEIVGTPEEALIKTSILRSMSKAIYTTKNSGHFGLGFKFYTHFTSPIRRYPDLLVHRILALFLEGKKVSESDFAFFKHISQSASQKEIAAAQAERASIKYKQVEYMTDHVGETFDATISGVTEWGIFVEEKETRSEGLIRIKDLGDDYYELNEKTYSIVGRKNKKVYSLGDPIKVTLIKADTENTSLDFALAK